MLTPDEQIALQFLVESDIPRTRIEMELSAQETEKLKNEGYLTHVGRQMSQKRGRPANLYWPTPKARRAVKKPMQAA